MISGCWRSVTYDGDMADVESLVSDNGLALLFNRRDWYIHNGERVYVGKHMVTDDRRKLAKMLTDLRQLARDTNNAPDHRNMKVMVDRCHT